MDTPDFNGLFDLNEINDLLDDCRDPYKKELGDRVTIQDYSSCTHMNGMELDSEEDREMQFNAMTYFVVIETDCNYIYNAYYKTYKQNLVIANPLTQKKFRINSGHVKLK